MSTAALGDPIALGRTAEVYAWKEGQVLKLFREWFPAEAVEYESRIARAVYATGLPVPAVGEIVEMNGRSGLVYERVEGSSMVHGFQAQPWLLFRLARLLAELQAELDTKPVTQNFPPQRQRLKDKIQEAAALPRDLREAALQALAGMPDGSQLCHGDFHPLNVLMTARGPIVIDWIDATRGNPLADVARSSVILLGDVASGSLKWVYKTAAHWFHAAYLKRYFELRPGGRQEFARWQPIVAAARMSENITNIQGWLLAQARAGLAVPDGGRGSAIRSEDTHAASN